MTGILFPADVFNRRQVDEEFLWQSDQASSDNAQIFLLQATDNPESPLKIIKQDRFNDETKLSMRGWMLTPDEYQSLESHADSAGYVLKTTAEQYRAAHYLPGWYELFKPFTPTTVWYDPKTESPGKYDFSALSDNGFIVKDFVKSRKHDWNTACFAPDVKALPSVVNEFVRLQEEDGAGVEGGIVVRAFEDFNKELGEARIWWVDFAPVLITPHPDHPELMPTVSSDFLSELTESVRLLGNPFITTDIAVHQNGSMRVVEVGDGQVSGLPVDYPAEPLWAALTV